MFNKEIFNIRVYGILLNEQQQLLVSDEIYQGQQFSKFPGGGLELGEGVADCLKREFIEEFNLTIDSLNLMYITEQVVPSAFDNSQVIGVYYQVFTDEDLAFSVTQEVFDFSEGEEQALRWVNLDEVDRNTFTFEMDQQAWEQIRPKLLI